MSSLLSFFMAGCKKMFNNENGGDHACEGGYDLNYDDEFYDDDDDDCKKKIMMMVMMLTCMACTSSWERICSVHLFW